MAVALKSNAWETIITGQASQKHEERQQKHFRLHKSFLREQESGDAGS